ncbi:MAG TPA: hypothetical protein VFU43_10975 [Streptosporangiaceae bacterium]|nr:hypothetical protein [Streptosporangiaceae bacterium]
MRLNVQAYSGNALTTPLPAPGQQAIAHIEQHAPQRLVTLVENLINDGTNTIYTFATWDDLAQAAKRLMTISMFNAVLPAELHVLANWQAGALTGSMAAAKGEISKAWANCGETAKNVITRLRANYGATISFVARDDFTSTHMAGLNGALMRVPPGAQEIFILDCDLQGAHNFLIEVHSNGDRYLVQGYQCQDQSSGDRDSYSAPWWVSDGLYEPTYPDSDLSDVANLRPQWGNRANIAGLYGNLVPILAAVVQHGFTATHAGAPAWPQLPFKPSDPSPMKTTEPPLLRVDLYALRNPQAVYANMPGVNGSVCAQAALSLPIPAPAVNVAEIQQVIGRLGLQAAYTFNDHIGEHKFKVTADLTGAHTAQIVNKVLLRVGSHEINVVRQTDLPPHGQVVEVGYMQAGLERTVNRTVQ